MTEENLTTARPRKHRRAVWTTIVASQLVVGMLTATGVFLVQKNWNDNIPEGTEIVHSIPGGNRGGVATRDDSEDGPINMLILGSDTREGAGNGIDQENSDGSERSDTVILLHVSADRSNAYGVSLPRDAVIDRPDCMVDGETVEGADAVMFNTAFAVGGAQCTLQTVEALTGILIDHFLVLDFNGFKDMVDAVDGVEVCIPKDVDDDEHDIHFTAGTQVLKGQDALNYVRERYVLSVTGDIGRMKRQQAFIASMVNKVMSAGTLTQPRKVISFINAVTSSIEVDSGLDTVSKLLNLAQEFRHTGLDKIKFLTVPIAEYPLDPNRLIWTEDAADLWARIDADEKLGKDFTADSIGADANVGTIDPQDDPDSQQGTDAEDRRAAGLCA